MTWQNSWNDKRKKEKPNSLRSKPTIAFRSNLCPETLEYINKLSKENKKSKFINQAIEMRFFMITNKKQFLSQVLESEYLLARFLLRKIGNRKKW